MSRKKIIFQSNAPFLKTGLSENGKILMNWLAKKDKYDLVYYCTQVMDNDPNLSKMPYRCYGAIPSNPLELQQLNQDPGKARDVAYGARYIEEIIKKEKPDIWLGVDDIWFAGSNYFKSEWFKKINSILHITIDSVPVLDQAYEQALNCKNYFSWTGFAPKEMKKRGKEFDHVDFIYGASNTEKYKIITKEQKLHLRKTFGIDPNTFIFIFLGRNQLRKEFVSVIDAFSQFKKENPAVNAKLLFHTSYSESSQGWDIPKMQKYYGLKEDDILCTMYCRNCSAWEVKPYNGEDKDCRFCGTQKSQISVNIAHGVPDEEMHLVYGLADAAISAFTSGGLEFHNVNSLLCGLPLACTNYSCGEDFCLNSFVHPIKWHSRHETGTNFKKASNDITSIKNFMSEMCRKSQKDLTEIGRKGREWAAKQFHIDTIGEKWEKLFDSLPKIDWSTVVLETKQKNPNYPNPNIQDDMAWVKDLYLNILNMTVENDDSGLKHWLQQLQNKMPREQIYQFFIKTAIDENNKNKPPIDFGELLDKNNGKKRGLIVIKQSIGDCLMITQLLESFHEIYPDHDLYIGTEPQYFSIFDGNPFIHKVLPYQSFMENEIICINAGGNQLDTFFHVYIHPAILSQRQLGYLSVK